MSERFCAMLAATLLFFGVSLERAPRLIDFNISEFYLGRADSCCIIYNVSGDAVGEYKRLFDVCGEKACGLDESDVVTLLRDLDARFLFEESAGGVTGRYYYSDKISAYKFVNGQKANLHTVFDGTSYCVGTPIIFGGY